MTAPSTEAPVVVPVGRELADALITVVVERMSSQHLSVTRVARAIGVTQSTLHRQLHGRGDLTIDEWQALAAELGLSLLGLLTIAQRRCA